MPKIFEYLAYIIRFYSNDHLPVHVHIQYQNRESKAEFIFDDNSVILIFKKLKGKEPLNESEAKEVAVFLKEYHLKIIEKWNKVFVYQQKVECEVINTKLRKRK